MTAHQIISSTIIALSMIVLIFYLVRKRRLREEYALIWMGCAVLMIGAIYCYPVLLVVTRLIGAVTPTTTLFLFGFVFILLLSLKITLSLSKLENQVKALSQKITLLEGQLEETLQQEDPPRPEPGPESPGNRQR
jgi:hypothetical protein